MKEGLSEIHRLVQEIDGHLKAGKTTDIRKAARKLERIAALASTLALTLQGARR
jgi:hypothetical protein